MPRRIRSADQLPLFGDGFPAPPIPPLVPVAAAGSGGVSSQTGPATAVLVATATVPEDGQPHPLPPHADRCVVGASSAPVERGKLFHAWAYDGFALTPAERLQDARAKFVAIYGVPPGMIAVPAAGQATYAELDPLVEAHEHTPAWVLWLLVTVGVRGRRDNVRSEDGRE